MPKKFLGQRIERDVDFVRPSSVTLTVDDLHRIPPFPSDAGEEGEQGFKSRISKKFGGTIKLRRRLESVPELFLHDLRKKPTEARAIKKRTILKRVEPPREILPVLKEEDSKPLFADNEFNKIFVPKPLVLPVKIQSMNNAFARRSNESMSSNELLFDEIISAYGVAPSRKIPKVLDSEIDRVLAHLSRSKISKKPATTVSPRIYGSDDLQPMTPILDPVSPDMLEKISSPEYTGTSSSDRWSSGDEFSEIISSEGGEDGADFVTATNSLRSSSCSPDLADKSAARHTLQPVKLRMMTVRPNLFVLPDSESCFNEDVQDDKSVQDLAISDLAAMQSLQQKIESIDIASVSSSTYSEPIA